MDRKIPRSSAGICWGVLQARNGPNAGVRHRCHGENHANYQRKQCDEPNLHPRVPPRSSSALESLPLTKSGRPVTKRCRTRQELWS